MKIQQLEQDNIFNILKYSKLFQFSITALSLLGVVMLLFSCENDIETINTITSKSNFPDQSFTNTEIIYSDSSLIRLRIITPELNSFLNTDEPYTEFPNGVTVYSFDHNQDVESTLSSKYAIYYESKNLWEARNDVEVINKKGEILNTEYLVWDEKKELVYSDKFVKITDNESVIYGIGFESNEKFSNWKIKKVKGIINVKNTNKMSMH